MRAPHEEEKSGGGAAQLQSGKTPEEEEEEEEQFIRSSRGHQSFWTKTVITLFKQFTETRAKQKP